jgi:hypothetical protein
VYVFCPNCGTENESAATPCKNCGFKLSGVSASKFKGTMMLNSDQTVQNLIDEHKKKQAAPAAPSAAPPAGDAPVPGKERPSFNSLAPLSELPGAPKSVMQPPRAVAGRRRMAGTMVGVAPQAGLVTPSPAEASSSPPPSSAEDLGAAGAAAVNSTPASQPSIEPERAIASTSPFATPPPPSTSVVPPSSEAPARGSEPAEELPGGPNRRHARDAGGADHELGTSRPRSDGAARRGRRGSSLDPARA